MQQGVRFESPGMGKARRVMALLPLSINAFDAERCDQRAHVTVQLALAEMPELNWQRAAQAPEHVDAHPGIREHPDATTANHDAPALETAGVRWEVGDEALRQFRGGIDRKSTRLNSSH